MKAIKFPETDLSEMRQFYQEELDKTLKRLQHIKAVLDQLGGSTPSIHIQVNAARPEAVRVTKGTAEPVKARQKPGRKSMWETLILKRLEQVGKPLTYDELTEEVMTFSKLPEEKRKNTKQAVLNVTFRLRKNGRKVDTFSVGTREKYIALKEWFDRPGQIKSEFADKIDMPKKRPAEVKIKKRRGRKPKAKTAAAAV